MRISLALPVIQVAQVNQDSLAPLVSVPVLLALILLLLGQVFHSNLLPWTFASSFRILRALKSISEAHFQKTKFDFREEYSNRISTNQ